jgi:hypothetical protein
MAAKRPSDDDANLVSKIQRIEHAESASPHQRLSNNDFSGSVKKKLADSKRTGQACDRCKVRTCARMRRQTSTGFTESQTMKKAAHMRDHRGLLS